MEKINEKLTDEDEKCKLKDPYGKGQVNFEQCLECSSALLSYLCMDELEYMTNVNNHDSAVSRTIKKNKDSLNILLQVM